MPFWSHWGSWWLALPMGRVPMIHNHAIKPSKDSFCEDELFSCTKRMVFQKLSWKLKLVCFTLGLLGLLKGSCMNLWIIIIHTVVVIFFVSSGRTKSHSSPTFAKDYTLTSAAQRIRQSLLSIVGKLKHETEGASATTILILAQDQQTLIELRSSKYCIYTVKIYIYT